MTLSPDKTDNFPPQDAKPSEKIYAPEPEGTLTTDSSVPGGGGRRHDNGDGLRRRADTECPIGEKDNTYKTNGHV
ncbi:hypothetical protein HGM15179_012177 [Zosterops borbonicus]|uniref:Uncharacterized protein n=1 Tax=Zosterops borbonicus TaxID=364589 RepID=A0A8K1GBE2_9PASS|nr:hypothetical protein HGM15179_012177 [Zosterops borbonicus]